MVEVSVEAPTPESFEAFSETFGDKPPAPVARREQ